MKFDAENVTLRAERDAAVAGADKEHATLVRVADGLRATRSRLDEAVAKLKDALLLLRSCGDYINHLGDCPQRDEVTDGCDCGFRQFDTGVDAFLAASQPSPSTPVPQETGGGGALCGERSCMFCRGATLGRCALPAGHPDNPGAGQRWICTCAEHLASQAAAVQPGEEPR